MENKNKKLQIRNSTAEFLIFQLQNKEDGVEVRYCNETLWLSQKAMATLFDCSIDKLKTALDKGTLLIISISSSPRQSKKTAVQRNKYVVDMVDYVYFGSISETSSLYSLYLYARDGGKDVVMLGNRHVIKI